MKVNDILNKIYETFPFVFTNDNGKAYVGGKEFIAKKDGPVFVKKGQRVVIGCSPISYGLYPGSGDCVGWDEAEVTQDMVGKTIAVFASIEIKTANDNLSKKQRIWNRTVRKAGGIAEVWKDVKDEIVRLKGGEIE